MVVKTQLASKKTFFCRRSLNRRCFVRVGKSAANLSSGTSQLAETEDRIRSFFNSSACSAKREKKFLFFIFPFFFFWLVLTPDKLLVIPKMGEKWKANGGGRIFDFSFFFRIFNFRQDWDPRRNLCPLVAISSTQEQTSLKFNDFFFQNSDSFSNCWGRRRI